MNIYLNFAGNCREVFEFYRSVFGGDFEVLQTFAEAPPEAGMPAEIADQVMHVSLPMTDGVLMGSDVVSADELVPGNNFSISLSPASRAEADRVFAALSADGTVEMALQETFWGSYFGSCRDRFGVNWMINHDLNG